MPAITKFERQDTKAATQDQTPAVENKDEYVAQKVTRQPSTTSKFTEALETSPRPAAPRQAVHNPALHAPKVDESGAVVRAPISLTTQDHPTWLAMKLDGRPVTPHAAPMAVTPMNTTVKQLDPSQITTEKIEGVTLTPTVIAQGDGTRAPSMITYLDSGAGSGQAEVLSTDAGRGGNIGKTVWTGVEDMDANGFGNGMVYIQGPGVGDPILAYNIGAALPPPAGGARYRIRGVFTTAAGIYFTVECRENNTGRVQSWCACITYPDANGNITLSASQAVVQDAEMTLNQEARGGVAQPRIVQVGWLRYYQGPNAGKINTVVVVKDANLVVQAVVEIEFLDANNNHLRSCAFGVRVDRQGNMYVDGRVEETPGGRNTNYTLRLNNDNATIPWANGTEPTEGGCADPENEGGNRGLELIGGGTAAAGVYTVGYSCLSVTNPGFDSRTVEKWDPNTGALIWGWSWYVLGFDFGGEDNAVDRDGNMLSTGNIGDAADRDMDLFKLDPTGGAFTGFDFLGNAAPPGQQDRGYGIALQTGSVTAAIHAGGSTTTAAGDMNYPVNGPDMTYNGGLDGLGVRYDQPLP